MQRDSYAILFKKQQKQVLPLRIIQMNGRITYERVFQESFFGYSARRIALVTDFAGCGSGTGGVGPSGAAPALQKDIVVESFQRLSQIHRPDMRYKLLPLMCTDMATFACLQAIVAATNSPFKIENRRDPVPLRIGWQNPKSPHREDVWAFFEDKISPEERAKPREARRMPCGHSIDFDGVLINGRHSSVAVLQMRPGITLQAIDEYKHQISFFRSNVFRTNVAMNSPLWMELTLMKNHYHILACPKEVERGMRSLVIQAAAKADIFLYEQSSATGDFQVVQ